MDPLLQKVEQILTGRDIVSAGEGMLVAVSGGCDSMVLLHVLATLRARHDWRLVVGHFNHCLRGSASDADESFVREAAAALEVPFVAGRGEVRRRAAAGGESLEVAARQLRLAFLAKSARSHDLAWVALGHQQDDQVELFFLRLLRGAGVAGLVGMQPIAPFPGEQGVRLVRPLLGFPRRELEAYAREHAIRWREDESNRDLSVPRNRVRADLIPILREHFQPALNRIVVRTAEMFVDEAALLAQLAEEWLAGRDCRTFDGLPRALQRHALRRQLERLRVEPSFDLIERLRRSPEVPIMLSPKRRIVRGADGRLHRLGVDTQKEVEFLPGSITADLVGVDGMIEFDGRHIHWRRFPCAGRLPLQSEQSSREEFFDAGQVGTRVLVRRWQPGDRFQPIGLAGAAKLQDLFTNAKVPRAERRWRLVAEGQGSEIFWVEGLRIGEKFKLTDGTRDCLVWNCLRDR